MLSTVFKNSFWYSFSSILLRASSIIFFPIFSSYLTKADYGILSMSQSLILIITSIAGIELQNALSRFINLDESRDSEVYKKKVIGNILIASAVSYSLVVIILLAFGQLILGKVLNDIPFYPYIQYSVIGLIFSLFVNLYRNYLKATHKGRASFVFDTAFFLSNIVLNLFFVVVMKTDVIGIIYSTVICGVIYSAISIYQFLKVSTFSFDKEILKSLLRYSVPLLPYIWLGLGIETVSTFFLNYEIGKDASGIFYIAVTFAGIFSTIKESIISAITPWFFEFYNSKKYLISKLVNHILWAGAIFCFGISVFSYEALHILSNNPNLIDGWMYVPLLVIGYLIVFVGQIYNLPIYHKMTQNKWLILSSVSGFLVTFLMAYLLTEKLALYGAVISRTIGYTIMTIVTLWISIRIAKFEVNFFKILFTILLFIPLFFVNYLPLPYIYLLIIKVVVSLFVVFTFLRSILKEYIGVRRKYVTIKQKIKS